MASECHPVPDRNDCRSETRRASPAEESPARAYWMSCQRSRFADAAASGCCRSTDQTSIPFPSAAIPQANRFFCRDQLQRSPRCKSGKLAAPGVSENKPPARRCRKPTGQRENDKRRPPPVKLLLKQSCSNRGGSRTLSMHWLKDAPKIKVSGSCASASDWSNKVPKWSSRSDPFRQRSIVRRPWPQNL